MADQRCRVLESSGVTAIILSAHAYIDTSQASCRRERASLVRDYGRKDPVGGDGQEKKGQQDRIAITPAKPLNPLHNMTVGELRVRCVAYPAYDTRYTEAVEREVEAIEE